jgi:endonuclease/exonuclease/phosphatase family metal-dependent hydrolase
MSKRTLTLALCCLLFLTGMAQSLYVGSYNIRYKNNGDAEKGNGWEQRCPVLCAQVNFEHPDIFGAQEVLVGQMQDMLQQLDGYNSIGVGREDGKEAGEYAAIFYDTKKLKLLDQGHFWLSETPEQPGLGWDAACTRICTWGLFKECNSLLSFYFFNLHMDHVGRIARREAAKLVVERIRAITARQHYPVVLTGDFNVDQNDEIYTIFTTSGILKDSYEHARIRFAENGTFNSYDSELKTISRIDHVFVSPEFNVDRYGVLTNCYWVPSDKSGEQMKGEHAPQEINFSKFERRLPSDHYPVFVHINL